MRIAAQSLSRVSGFSGKLQFIVGLSFAMLLAPTTSGQDQVLGWGSHVVNGIYHGESFSAVGAGEATSMGIRSDGSLAMWGLNYTGACNMPSLPPGTSVVQVVGGLGHTLARLSDGSVLAWGRNAEGQCNVPVRAPGTQYTKVAAGTLHSIALRSDGIVVAWGSNSHGQGSVPFGGTFMNIAAAGNTNVAVTSSGTLAGWGDNMFLVGNEPAPPPGEVAVDIAVGAFGSYIVRWSNGALQMWGTQSFSCVSPIPTLPAGVSWMKMAALSDQNFVALRSDGQIVTWKCLGAAESLVITPLPPGLTYTDIAAQGAHLVALRSDGRIVVMEPPGIFSNRLSQHNIPDLPAGVSYQQLAFSRLTNDFGSEITMALRTDGQIVHYGVSQFPVDFTSPGLPPGMTYTQVAVGEIHACAIRSDGIAVAWPSFSNIFSPPSLPAGQTYTRTSAGAEHALYLRSDGAIMVAGFNNFGEGSVPPLPVGTSYTQIASREYSCMALRSDGVVRIWGNWSTANGSIPPAPPGQNYSKIVCGADHFLALRSDGEIFGGGDNSYGQFPAPVLPPGVSYVDVAAGDYHSVALRSDGEVVVFGLQGYPGSSFWNNAVIPAPPSGYHFARVFAGSFRTAALVSPEATSLSFGLGCTGANGITTLTATNIPYLGNPAFDLALSGGASSSAAYLFYATAEALPPMPIAPGCRIYLDLTSALAFVNLGQSPFGPVFTDLSGNAGFSVALPAHPAFNGLSLYFQAAVFDLSVATGLTLSNGVRANLD
jgi:alpha-tubulin suppressor-like RCC1 family protein